MRYNTYKEYILVASLETSEARRQFADTINRVLYGKERVVLHRRGKDVAVLVPMEDLARLEELEDRLDVEHARETLAESDERIAYDQARREFGLE